MSYLNIIFRATLFSNLNTIDRELASRCRLKGCPHCGGALHSAHYKRQPRGAPIDIPEEHCVRYSLCCGHCRRRTLPTSVLFFGRKVYFGCVIVMLTAVAQGLERRTLQPLCDQFGVSRKTIKRWLSYFLHAFPGSDVWKQVRGKVSPHIGNLMLPLELLRWFFASHTCPQQALLVCLCLLAGVPGIHDISGGGEEKNSPQKMAR
jgi:hypothetical protein